MSLKQTDYTQIEYEDDCGMVVGSIIYKHGKFIHAMIHDEYVSSVEDIEKIEEFFNVVKMSL